MKKMALFISSVFLAVAPLAAQDITDEIPTITVQQEGFQHIPDVAQYGEADWSNVIGIARGISLVDAFEIARNNPQITFFFYTKGWQMVLGTPGEGNFRVFHHGDTVFFSGEPWWGSAPGLADGYVKE